MAAADCVLGGYKIPKGTAILPMMVNAHIDPAHWERPSEFIPERFSKVFVLRNNC